MVDKFVRQLDGCTYTVNGSTNSGGYNCSCATHAMWEYRVTNGRINRTSCQERRLTGDHIDGTNLEQMQAIAIADGITGSKLWRPGKLADLKPLLRSGLYVAHVQIGYSALVGTAHDCFHGGFRGAHDMYFKGADAYDVRYGDPGADGRYSGCPSGWQSMSWSLLERAAGALPLKTGGPTLYQEYGSGYVYALISPRLAVPTNHTYLVHVVAPDSDRVILRDRPFGTRKGSVTRATYICTLSKVANSKGVEYWWYKILTKADGSHTDNAGLYFTPNRYTRDAEQIS